LRDAEKNERKAFFTLGSYWYDMKTKHREKKNNREEKSFF
jgi:hypothetical protein